MTHNQIPAEVSALIERGAMFVINHSGGKDSQAMFHFVRRFVPDSQIIVVHAELPEADWQGTLEHVQATTLGLPVLTCRAVKTFIEMVTARGMFPSPTLRQCTSDLKRGPIERTIRRTGHKLIVNCVGIRAEESSSRAKAEPFKFSARNSLAGREWYDWLPIHDWKVGEVFAAIADAGQAPHWAYAKGMSRLSCCFCIMASKQDLTIAAQLNPELYARFVELEETTGHTMLMPSKALGRRTLEQVTGIKAQRFIPIKIAA